MIGPLTAKQAREKALRLAHELRGKISSAEKQALYGSTNRPLVRRSKKLVEGKSNREIAADTLPSLYRRLDEAERIARVASQYVARPPAPPVTIAPQHPTTTAGGNDYKIDEETLEIPAFLRRNK